MTIIDTIAYYKPKYPGFSLLDTYLESEAFNGNALNQASVAFGRYYRLALMGALLKPGQREAVSLKEWSLKKKLSPRQKSNGIVRDMWGSWVVYL
jgi:hypothetical protein